MSWTSNKKERFSMSLIPSSLHPSHLHIPLLLLLILPLLNPILSSAIPLTFPMPPTTLQTAVNHPQTIKAESALPNPFNATNSTTSFIDNLRSLRSVLMICWRHTVTSMRNNISANSIDKSFKSWGKDSIEELRDCLMTRALAVFDRAVNRDAIQVVPGWLKLVRNRRDDVEDSSTGFSSRELRERKSFDSDERQIFDWRLILLRRLLRLLRNHHFEIHLNPHHDHDSEGRRRNHFMPMLVFGAITSSIIAIPMMFQFLSVLGGKALLLAKLALILTAIQGLKKVATSNFSYGLYNSPGFNNNPWQQYDRKYFFDMNMDYTPPGAGLANPYAEHLDRVNSNSASIPERTYIPDHQQVLRPRNTVVSNVDA